ncbi:MAG: ammonium transporter [Proteobacteria bacterium]|nr:ammonium transporter [Pseudomonadota bacterium]
MLISTALVMLMTPGLALFYGGMVRKKNVLGTMMHSLIAIGVVTAIWVIFGYSLAFGPDKFNIIGSLDYVFLNNVTTNPHPDYSPTIPHQLFMAFQLMFAIITPALISGAIAERIKFSSYLVFLILWLIVVYLPVAHWVWGVGGWIRNMGALDFAGGLVVHIISGFSALAGCIVLGKRKGYLREPMPPHNLTMTLLGTAILWFGWFGFNGGSAIASNQLSVTAFINTHIASAIASLSWLISEWIHRKKPTLLGLASGVVAGLVAITPAAGFVTPFASFLIGLVAGPICYMAVSLKARLGYDDALDAVGVHGVGGTVGAIATGLFATKAINSAGNDGLFYGNPSLLWAQIISVIVSIFYAFIVSYILFKIIDKMIGLRVSNEEEIEGLDISQHGENGYGW